MVREYFFSTDMSSLFHVMLAFVVFSTGQSLPPIETGVRITKPTCVDIPPSLGLCYNIGYTTMRMPNLLDHDSLFEVRYQARSWIPLLLHRCHTDTQLFLCSLFAPVCLDRPIYPCRSLCESVRDGCEPLMRQNCFEWPEMLECNKFPEDNDLCIKSEMLASSNSTASEFQLEGGIAGAVGQLFTQCHTDSPPETIFDYSCNADFVLKMRIASIREVKEEKRYRGDPEKVTVYKQGSLRAKDIKKLNFYVREGTNCRCEMLHPGKQFLLVMGHKEGKQMYMTFVHSWSREREFRSVIRSIQDGTGCPVQTTTTSAFRVENQAANHGEEIPTEELFPNSDVSDTETEEEPSSKPGKGGKRGKTRLTKEERRALRRLARQQEQEQQQNDDDGDDDDDNDDDDGGDDEPM